MNLFAVIMSAAAVLLFAVSYAIYRGRVDLIHDYHQDQVKEKDKPAYGQAMGKCLFVMSAGMLSCGIISLFGDDKGYVLAGIAVLFACIIMSVIMIVKVQKKFNGKVM